VLVFDRRRPEAPEARWREAEEAIAQVSFSPDGRLLLEASRSGSVLLRSVATFKVVARLPGHVGGVRAATFSRRVPTLATCGEDKQVRVWELTGLRRELAKMHLNWQEAPYPATLAASRPPAGQGTSPKQ